ncbi:MAG: AAA family ATPase, partial [Oscillospiraceae bacterium]|nr:AAA family ATPase [Oscillospiraceae bacterium]
MLKELVIENVAVIEKADVTFDTGLNILTGETGAGKSIIIDSINAIMGNRTSREIVRTGTDRASIFAEFDALGADAVTMISEMGYGSDDTLILNREITADGKSRCRINGMPATAQAMREICSTLINIHGQHDSQDLLNPERHIHILDDFSGIGDQLAAYGSVYSELQAVRKAISGINTDVAYKERQKDLLSYQISEIAGAELRPGEEEQLNEQRKIIRNAEKLREALSAAIDAISGNENEGASDLIYRAAASVESVAGISEALAKNAERLNDTYYQLNDISEDLRSALEEFEGSGDDIDAVE